MAHFDCLSMHPVGQNFSREAMQWNRAQLKQSEHTIFETKVVFIFCQIPDVPTQIMGPV